LHRIRWNKVGFRLYGEGQFLCPVTLRRSWVGNGCIFIHACHSRTTSHEVLRPEHCFSQLPFCTSFSFNIQAPLHSGSHSPIFTLHSILTPCSILLLEKPTEGSGVLKKYFALYGTSLLCWEDSATGFWPEPNEFSPRTHTLHNVHFNVHLYTCLGFQDISYFCIWVLKQLTVWTTSIKLNGQLIKKLTDRLILYLRD
jgi:hypothetical protein